jgi:hypothetical protein
MVLICFCFGVYFNTAYLTLNLLAAVEFWRWEFLRKSSYRSQLQYIIRNTQLVYLFIVYYDIYNDNVPSTDTVVSRGKMITEQWIGEDRGSIRGLISAIFLDARAGVRILSNCMFHGEHRFRACFCFIYIILPVFVTFTLPFSSRQSVPWIYLNPLFHSRFPEPWRSADKCHDSQTKE